MRRAPLLLVAGVLMSAGCASAPAGPAASGGAEQSSLYLPGAAGKARPRTPDGGPKPITGDPYAKRPGARQKGDRTPPPTVLFDAPAEAQRTPVRRSGALVSPARLAVVFVRDGSIQHDGQALLELDRLLGKDPDLQTIVRLGDLSGPSASLAALAKAAKAEHRDLVLVEVRSTDGAERESYLLTAEGLLVARYEGGSDGTPMRVDRQGEEPVIARIGQALGRLKP